MKGKIEEVNEGRLESTWLATLTTMKLLKTMNKTRHIPEVSTVRELSIAIDSLKKREISRTAKESKLKISKELTKKPS